MQMSHVTELVCWMTGATIGTIELVPLVVQYMVVCELFMSVAVNVLLAMKGISCPTRVSHKHMPNHVLYLAEPVRMLCLNKCA